MVLGHTDLKVGTLIELEGVPYRVTDYTHKAMGRGGAVVQTKLKNLIIGGVIERSFRSSDKVNSADVTRAQMQLLYRDGDDLVFMNNETYEQLEVSKDILGDDMVFLEPNMQVEIEFYEGQPMGATLPPSVVLEIVETDPVMKNANATGSYKPAKLDNGITVGVPPYMEAGQKIRVNTVDRTFMERVK